jgi:hypothetical protein
MPSKEIASRPAEADLRCDSANPPLRLNLMPPQNQFQRTQGVPHFFGAWGWSNRCYYWLAATTVRLRRPPLPCKSLHFNDWGLHST